MNFEARIWTHLHLQKKKEVRDIISGNPQSARQSRPGMIMQCPLHNLQKIDDEGGNILYEHLLIKKMGLHIILKLALAPPPHSTP